MKKKLIVPAALALVVSFATLAGVESASAAEAGRFLLGSSRF